MNTDRLPSGRGYLVAALLTVATIVVLVVLALGLVRQMVGLFDLATFEGPGRANVPIERTGTHTIYAEIDRRLKGGPRAEPPPEPEAAAFAFIVRDAVGTVLDVVGPEKTTLTVNERGYLPLASFTVKAPGPVAIEASWADPAHEEPMHLAVGLTVTPRDVAGTAGRVGLLVLVAVVGLGGALAFFLVTLIRRANAARRLEAEHLMRFP